MRSSTLVATAALPALIAGCLFSAAALAAPDMSSSALRDVDTFAVFTRPYPFELDAAFAMLSLGSAAWMLARLAGPIGRWITGPQLRVQEEID